MATTEKINLLSRVQSIDSAPTFSTYSKLVIHLDDETYVEAGNDTGRTLEISDPFGTQAKAQELLAKLAGLQYQPYYAKGAILDPAAEIGDAVSIKNVYGGIYQRLRRFDRQMQADIAAPHDEEINHEYQYETPQQRKFSRQLNDIRASLIIANGRIDASVAKTGGEESSFGWSLTSDAHRWFADGQEVMSVTASGLSVKGNVQATSGTIGGFTIGASALFNNMPSMSATQTSGVYLGTDGIKLGQSFRVDSTGGVTATRLAVDTLYIGGTAVSAATLNARANNGNSAYSWTSSNGSYVRGGAGYGYSYNNATNRNSGSYPGYFRASYMNADYMGAGTVVASNILSLGSYNATWKSATVKNAAGNNITIYYLGR